MIRIVALNDEENDETEGVEDEVVATKEAQETIAESEYVRAIKLKSDGKVDLCLDLLNALLQTQVLNDNIKSSNNEKLWVIKYNCHKNIAIILEERCDYTLALQHYISAILIDNTDVYTLHKFGQLALKLNAIDLAEYAFENCLARNSGHWCAADGMLEVMSKNHNIIGAYSWANKICRLDPHSQKATQTLQEIAKMFGKNLNFFEKCSGIVRNHNLNNTLEDEESFKVLINKTEETVTKNEEDFSGSKLPESLKVKSLNWYSIGQFIVNIYNHLTQDGRNMLFVFEFKDIVANQQICIPNDQLNATTPATNLSKQDDNVDQELNSKLSEAQTTDQSTTIQPTVNEQQCDAQSMDSNNYDSDSNAKSDGGETVNKSKPRRRCSDLHFLEQWGWHKSRRYSSRKKNERDEIDTSLNGYLRKLLMKFTEQNIDEKWPFSNKRENGNAENSEVQCNDCKTTPLNDDDSYHDATKYEFDKFINNLESKHQIDLMVLIYKWLKYISMSWKLAMPDKIKTLYMDIFEFYITHFDLSTWNQLTSNQFDTSYNICLLYLELSLKRNINCNSDLWLKVFNHLLFHSGNCKIIQADNIELYQLRLMYLEYLLFNEKNQFEDCLLCLEQMLEIISRQKESPSFSLHMPNSNNVCINTKFIENARRQYKRQIEVNSIPNLFENGLWPQLTEIIISSIESGADNYEDDNWLTDFRTEIEILLQAFWKMSSYENCLIWCEKSFHYCVSHYLDATKSTQRHRLLSELINFITSYIEAIILNEGFHIVVQLNEECLSRLVQNIIRILVYQFEGSFDKNSSHGQELDFKRPWVILHQLVLREENDSPNTLNTKCDDIEDVSELIPNSFLILFTAHEYLGKRQWCTNDNGEFLQYILDAVVLNLKAPIYDVCRDVIYEYIEQVTYCLFKYPQKKARSRHLEDHEASQVKLSWPKAVQIYDLYRPEVLPEFNSFKMESISSDMEQLLLKIIMLMPQQLDPSTAIHYVNVFIEGSQETPPSESNAFKMPYKIRGLFYLLADYYFKNRDFIKAIKYYTLDLAVNPTRFDSWAGMALSKASKIETKLNGLDPINLESLWEECEEVLRCFECCINLNRFQTLLWIEYGSFSYTIHSYFSRYLKSNSPKLSTEVLSSIEERKSKMLTISYNCFSCANSLQNSTTEENSDSNDEKWLCQYMLGKVSEKRKEAPKIYLNHYLMAANYLYDNSATYPIKINHSNPTTLSVEALEIFYRINAAIIKYLEQEKEISRCTGVLFNKVLKSLSSSPFAYNKAKIDGNSLNILKGKVVNKFKPPANYTTKQNAIAKVIENDQAMEKINNSQKESQDNSNTPANTTTAAATMIINSASAISSDSSTVESESESEDSQHDNDNNKPKNDAPFTPEELKSIYGMVVQNIEECVTRFPEHYKSIYRLTNHYLNSPLDSNDLKQSEQLLLGQYRTSLGNLVNGLFFDRKNNNLFNGIWRIPSSEIDRPGSFSTHLVKCVNIFIQLLYRTNNHKILMDVALNLYKIPDSDKRYITDAERKELCQQSINYCVQILRAVLQKNMQQRDDNDTMNLLINIYKIHRNCVKHMNQKEPLFTNLLIEVYKFFIKDKVEHVPENCNFLDLAIKLCVQEITAQKMVDKSNTTDNTTNTSDYIVSQSTNQISNTRIFNIPGLNIRPKARVNPSKTSAISLPSAPDFMKSPQFMSMMTLFGGSNHVAGSDTPEFQKLFEEYYTKILENEQRNLFSTNLFAPNTQNRESEKQDIIPNSSTNTSVSIFPSTSKMTTTQITPKAFQPTNAEDNYLAAYRDNAKSQTKAKSSMKMKPAYKPYNRPVDSENSMVNIQNSNKTPQNVFNNYEMDAFSNHANMLTAYSNLLQSTTLSQIDFMNKNMASVAKKPKTSRSETINTNPFLNVATSVNQTTSSSYISPGLISSSNFVPTMQMPNFSLQQSTVTTTISPTKTLQEKLAERQKASQLNETNASLTTSTVDEKMCGDIIILD